LGSTDAEHQRLIAQAAYLAPLTERLFREAGISPGHRVLDIGSGVGDVAMLAARIVGPTGAVVGIERDTSSITRARERAAAAGLHNIRFAQADASDYSDPTPFDAAVGRFILMYLPDPAAGLRSVARLVRPGGILAFQEPSFTTYAALVEHLPLASACVALVIDAFGSSGAHPQLGFEYGRLFHAAGLPAPTVNIELLLSGGADFPRGLHDLLLSLRPTILQYGLPTKQLGDFDTLRQRLEIEAAQSHRLVGYGGAIGARSRTPAVATS
jgi:SAM-dependent methyltransferase